MVKKVLGLKQRSLISGCFTYLISICFSLLQTRPIQSRFLQSRNLNCIALCEVITSKDLQKHGNIWVCPVSDHVCTRFFFVYEDGQVGDANINTQDPKIQKEIMRVIGTQVYTS
uniref:Poly(ADP-ribose) polymerase family member 6 n=1 Tax=Callorhinchus milii TaxID=7868 RepID=A0A4W3I9A5_CALMI